MIETIIQWFALAMVAGGFVALVTVIDVALITTLHQRRQMMHRIFGGMGGSNYIWGEKIIIRSLAKDSYTGFLVTDGRLETYLGNDLVWTSYFIGEDYAEAEFSDTVDLMIGEIFA